MGKLNKRIIGNNCFLVFFMCTFLVSCASQRDSTSTVPQTDRTPDKIDQPVVKMPDSTAQSMAPESAMVLLKDREGFEEKVYRGKNSYLTAGFGHILSNEEKTVYLEGDSVPKNIIDQWLVADSQESWDAAVKQALQIGDGRLAEPLFAVNYQLGIFWHTKHKKTWAMLKKNNWRGTVKEFMTSKWCKQTPLRCEDFKKALLAL